MFIDEAYKIRWHLQGFLQMIRPILWTTNIKALPKCGISYGLQRGEDIGPIKWEVFKRAFLDWFFQLELRWDKIQDFMNLRQGNMNVRQFALKCTFHGYRSEGMNEQVDFWYLGLSN